MEESPASDRDKERCACAALLRIALAWPQIAGEIAEHTRGLIHDFRIARVFHQIGERAKPGLALDAEDATDIVQSIQGAELRRWFEQEVAAQTLSPYEEAEARRFIDECVKYLERLAGDKEIDRLGVKARAALGAEKMEEYKALCAHQQALRRKLKAITY